MDASLKADYELVKIIKEYCKKKGIKMRYFTDEALRKELENLQK